jgi:MFS family permease
MGTLGSAYFVGWMVSSLIVPWFSDNYGRRYVVFVSCLIATLVGIGLIISTSFLFSCLLLFVSGLSASGCYIVSWCYNMEMLHPKW